MKLSNVRLVLAREVRDQLRDRRTLFMIFVLPLLLYPLLGMGFFQMAQFMREKSSRILIVGVRDPDMFPGLFDNAWFSSELFGSEERRRLLEIVFAPQEPQAGQPEPGDTREDAWLSVQRGDYDAALFFPADFAERLDAVREELRARPAFAAQSELAGKAAAPATMAAVPVPSPEVMHNTAIEKSQIAFSRLSEVLRRWTEQVGIDNLAVGGVPPMAARPFSLESADVAYQTPLQGAARWSKILPMMLVLWAMTGAFYPAVDLCAGEKERGTMETLLCSPALRSEIVVGKLLTVILFSSATAVLNLVSVGVTGSVVLSQFEGFGSPPLLAIVWLGAALLPVAALFSALCLALAAFARSTKEGQYYLMPLMLVTLPLCVLPMAPGVELTLGNSLIPVTGVALLLRSALEGNYWQAMQFAPPVIAVTSACCLLAIRWAIDQFNSEGVLFRESERFDVAAWLRHLFRDRQPTPTAAAAVMCGVLILLARFFLGSALEASGEFAPFVRSVLILQVVIIAGPALLLTLLFTSSPRQTLMLKRPVTWWAVPTAALLAVLLHPAMMVLRNVVESLYPISEKVKEALGPVERMFAEAPFWSMVAVIALVPAVCEELAFRGFILSGFMRSCGKWRAIVYTAVLFGLAHGILQQSLIACLVGVAIGFITVQSGSLWPAVVYHLLNNGLAVAGTRITPELLEQYPLLGAMLSGNPSTGYTFHWQIVVAGMVAALMLLRWFARLPCPKTLAEELRDAVRRRLAEPEEA
ncbi:MAG: ABC transporter permease subunit/CPBP intramembrane protease [Patescibacteria group bacterium]|nr:ABC transporter permease subunit/CPBP intramembrane protease [Patescibacteria group bacterium]